MSNPSSDRASSNALRRPMLLPAIVIALGSAGWGLFWLPLRALAGAGLGTAWCALGVALGSLLVLFPIALLRRRALLAGGWPLLGTGLLTGGAFGLYLLAILETEVVRAILLFYLTPVWGTLLGWWLLGEALTRARVLALAIGLLGLLVVLGKGTGFPMPRNLGDWVSLIAGMLWALGSLRLYRERAVGSFESVFSFTLGTVTVLALMVPFLAGGTAPSGEVLARVAPWLMLFVIALNLPTNFMILYGAAQLSPGRAGILLMTEVIVGVVSAAALSGEPFGPREATGAALIIAAGVVELRGKA